MTSNTPSVTQNRCNYDPAYNSLIQLRTVGLDGAKASTLATSIDGRITNSRPFNQGLFSSYDNFKMRRKAETLKFRTNTGAPGYVPTDKQNYAQVVKTGGSSTYSSTRLRQLLAANNGVFPANCQPGGRNIIVLSTPTQSGVVGDHTTEGYYLDPFVTYYPTL
jgi:hypothetical protein